MYLLFLLFRLYKNNKNAKWFLFCEENAYVNYENLQLHLRKEYSNEVSTNNWLVIGLKPMLNTDSCHLLNVYNKL